MNVFFQRCGLLLAAGIIGGAAVTVIDALIGTIHVPTDYGVDFAPISNVIPLYTNLIWGALFGLLFLIPLLDKQEIIKGVLISFLPSLFQLFILFPIMGNTGFLALEKGSLMPFYVIALNVVWGATAGAFLKWSKL